MVTERLYPDFLYLEPEERRKRACDVFLGLPNDINLDYVKEEGGLSMWYNAMMLAKEIRDLQENKRWKIVAQVWVEMLSFAAINCRPYTLVQQLTKGGELISFVWLLMFHLGLGSRQFKNQALEYEDENE